MQWLGDTLLDPIIQGNLITSFLVVITIWLLRAILLRVASRRFDDTFARYQWRRISSYIAVALIIALVGPTWIGGFNNIATYLGLLSAGLAIALQPLIIDFVGWIFRLSDICRGKRMCYASAKRFGSAGHKM
jgi:hypothetical protein